MTETSVPSDKRALALILRDKIIQQLRDSKLKPGDALPTEKVTQNSSRSAGPLFARRCAFSSGKAWFVPDRAKGDSSQPRIPSTGR